MGECGCGDRDFSYWTPGPPGFFYAVQVWNETCRSCGAEPGVVFGKWPDKDKDLIEGVPMIVDHVFIPFLRSRRRPPEASKP